jgi:hypothetical protein
MFGFGGTGDPHLTASHEGLTYQYKSKHFDDFTSSSSTTGNKRQL